MTVPWLGSGPVILYVWPGCKWLGSGPGMLDVMVGNMAMSLLFWWSGLAHVGDVVCNMNVMVMVWNMMLIWFDDQLSMANSCIIEQ